MRCHRLELQQLVNRHNTAQQIVLRAKIILLASEGKNHGEIARTLDISLDMARLWRNRWLETNDKKLEPLLVNPPPEDKEFDAKVEDITGLYINAIACYQNGERTISIDEMTGIQATERLEKDLPMRPGKVERRECEYVRHGTQSLIANFDVATGKIIEPTCGDSRSR